MTGLGSYYTRYSLNSESFNIGYDGKGCLLAAQLMPRHAKGWYARAAFESLTTERLNKSNNTGPHNPAQNPSGDPLRSLPQRPLEPARRRRL
ncbi:MAG: hypothetical protein ACLUQ6_00065 [Alistipes onderdonkii]